MTGEPAFLAIVSADTVAARAAGIGAAHDPVVHLVAAGDDQRATSLVGVPGVGGKRAGFADSVGAVLETLQRVIGQNGAECIWLEHDGTAIAPSPAELAGEQLLCSFISAFGAEKGPERGHVLLKNAKSAEGSVLTKLPRRRQVVGGHRAVAGHELPDGNVRQLVRR